MWSAVKLHRRRRKAVRLASSGDVKDLAAYLILYPKTLNGTGAHGLTCLQAACINGRIEMVVFLFLIVL